MSGAPTIRLICDPARATCTGSAVRLARRGAHDEPASVLVSRAAGRSRRSDPRSRSPPPTRARRERQGHGARAQATACCANPCELGKLRDMHDLACVVHLHSTHSDGTGTVPEIARAAARAQGRRGAAHRPRHARGEAARRGGLVRRRAAAGGRGGLAARARPLPGLRHRRGDPPPRPRRLRDRAGGPRRRRLRLRRASVLRGLACASSGGPACRSAASTATPSTASSCGASRTTPASGSAASRRCCASLAAPGARARPSARAQHAALGRALPRAARGGDRRPRRAPVREADRARGAAARDGLPPLASASSARTCSASEAPAGELERDRELVFDALRGAAATSRSTRWRPRAASASRPTTCPWAARRRRAGGRCGCARRWPPAAAAARRRARSPRPRARHWTPRSRSPAYTAPRRSRHAHGRERTWILSNPIYLR